MQRRRQLEPRLAALLQAGAARPAVGAGMRAATATVLPLLVGQLTNRQAFLWMALGGYLCSLADPGGVYRSRARYMLAYTAGAAAVCLASALLPIYPTLDAPLFFAVAFVCCMARALGETAGTVGGLVLVLFCVLIGSPPGVGGGGYSASAPARAVLLTVGALNAMVLSLALWPFHPYRPVRRLLADCYVALADYLEELLELLELRGAPAPDFDALARRERARIREALERARSALLSARVLRQGETKRGEVLLGLYETVDLLFGRTGAMAELLRTAPRGGLAEEEQALRELVAALGAVAATLEGRQAPIDASPLTRARGRMRPRAKAEAAAQVDRLLAGALLAVELAEALREGRARPRKVRGLSAPPAPPSAWTLLRAELAPGSLTLRHSLRVATTVSLALLVSQALHLPRVQWVLVTVVLVLQPAAGASFRRGLQRVAGTVLGGTLAALFSTVAHTPIALAAILFPLSAAGVSLLPVHYGLFSTLITPVFVLMSESVAGDWHLTRTRILNTLFGGALALCSAALLWPSWEHERRPALVAALLRATRDYLAAVLDPAREAERLAARREVGIAAGNLEASLQRALTEPRAQERALEAVMVILSWARRFSGTASSLSELVRERQILSPGHLALAVQLQAALAALEEAVLAMRAPAPLPFAASPDLGDESEAAHDPIAAHLARLARQIVVMHGALEKLLPPAPAANRGEAAPATA